MKLTDMEGQLHRMPESAPRTLSKTKAHHGFLHQRLGACRYKCVLSLNFLVIIRLIFQKHFCVVYSFLYFFLLNFLLPANKAVDFYNSEIPASGFLKVCYMLSVQVKNYDGILPQAFAQVNKPPNICRGKIPLECHLE